MAEKQEMSTVLPARMQLNLLELLAMAIGKKKSFPTSMSSKVQPKNKDKCVGSFQPSWKLVHIKVSEVIFEVKIDFKNVRNATFEISFMAWFLQRCQSRKQDVKLGLIPPHGMCPKLPSHQDASAVSPFVVFCLRLLLRHRSVRFALVSCGHCNLSYIHPAFILQAFMSQMFHKGTKLI